MRFLVNVFVFSLFVFKTGYSQQSIFSNNDTVAFITKTKRNGLSYNSSIIDTTYSWICVYSDGSVLSNGDLYTGYKHISLLDTNSRFITEFTLPIKSTYESYTYPLYKPIVSDGIVYYQKVKDSAIKIPRYPLQKDMQIEMHELNDLLKVSKDSFLVIREHKKQKILRTNYLIKYIHDTLLYVNNVGILCYVFKGVEHQGDFSSSYYAIDLYVEKKTLLPIVTVEKRYNPLFLGKKNGTDVYDRTSEVEYSIYTYPEGYDPSFMVKDDVFLGKCIKKLWTADSCGAMGYREEIASYLIDRWNRGKLTLVNIQNYIGNDRVESIFIEEPAFKLYEYVLTKKNNCKTSELTLKVKLDMELNILSIEQGNSQL